MDAPKHPAWFERPGFYLWTTALVVVAFLASVLIPAPINEHRASQLSSAKQLALALVMYAADNDDRLPPAQAWQDASMQYSVNGAPENLYSSDGNGKSGKKFAFFEALSCVSPELFTDESEVPMVFQSVLTERNAHGSLDQADWPLGGRCYVGFLDCHAKAMPKSWRFGAVTIHIK